MIAAFIDGLFRYQFLQNALLTSVIVGLISGVIGSFIILRGMSLMGDAISHAVLPGVAVSYMFGFNYIFGASIFGLLAALSIGFITQKSPLKNDTAIGVVFSSFYLFCKKFHRFISYSVWKCISGRRYRYFNYLCRRRDCFDFCGIVL